MKQTWSKRIQYTCARRVL